MVISLYYYCCSNYKEGFFGTPEDQVEFFFLDLPLKPITHLRSLKLWIWYDTKCNFQELQQGNKKVYKFQGKKGKFKKTSTLNYHILK